MTGWRIGWIAAPTWLASACNTLQDNILRSVIHLKKKPPWLLARRSNMRGTMRQA